MARNPTPILVLAAETEERHSPSAVQALLAGALEVLPTRSTDRGTRNRARHRVRQLRKVVVVRHPRGGLVQTAHRQQPLAAAVDRWSRSPPRPWPHRAGIAVVQARRAHGARSGRSTPAPRILQRTPGMDGARLRAPGRDGQAMPRPTTRPRLPGSGRPAPAAGTRFPARSEPRPSEHPPTIGRSTVPIGSRARRDLGVGVF